MSEELNNNVTEETAAAAPAAEEAPVESKARTKFVLFPPKTRKRNGVAVGSQT